MTEPQDHTRLPPRGRVCPRPDLTHLTPYEKRARYPRTIRRNRRRERCRAWIGDGTRCTTRAAAGTGYCLLHTPGGDHETGVG